MSPEKMGVSNLEQCCTIKNYLDDELEWRLDNHYDSEREFVWITGLVWLVKEVLAIMNANPHIMADEAIFGLQCYLSGNLPKNSELVELANDGGELILGLFEQY